MFIPMTQTPEVVAIKEEIKRRISTLKSIECKSGAEYCIIEEKITAYESLLIWIENK